MCGSGDSAEDAPLGQKPVQPGGSGWEVEGEGPPASEARGAAEGGPGWRAGKAAQECWQVDFPSPSEIYFISEKSLSE